MVKGKKQMDGTHRCRIEFGLSAGVCKDCPAKGAPCARCSYRNCNRACPEVEYIAGRALQSEHRQGAACAWWCGGLATAAIIAVRRAALMRRVGQLGRVGLGGVAPVPPVATVPHCVSGVARPPPHFVPPFAPC